MITKKTFTKTMEQLRTLDKKMDAVDSAMKELEPDFCGFYITSIFDITLNVLQEAMGDTEEWISYCVYDKNWLQNFKLGDVAIMRDDIEECVLFHNVDLSTWDKVYDFLAGEVNGGHIDESEK